MDKNVRQFPSSPTLSFCAAMGIGSSRGRHPVCVAELGSFLTTLGVKLSKSTRIPIVTNTGIISVQADDPEWLVEQMLEKHISKVIKPLKGAQVDTDSFSEALKPR